MSGYRAKIGLMVPTTNTVMEPEFYAMVPAGVSVHSSRIMFSMESGESFVEQLRKMAEDIDRSVKELSLAHMDVIAYGCTSGSFLEGAKWNEEITRKMQGLTNAKVVTTSTAVLEALKQLKMNRIAIATPYPDDVNERAKPFFVSQGIRVADIKGLNIADPHELARQPPAVAYALAKSLDRNDIDGIFISCTDFRTIEIIEMLERDVNKPVVTSNQATFWMCLRLGKVRDRIDGYGRLLKEH